ncbi:uncharacterized protein [Acropora muricata]|uniref:uncharacterized protein LOC114963196 n=1 Tax=Acropora millepora TaxID=45264 RepID=UPI0010FC7B5F|nr:uncharacterized protein LOC114963196 [Acropora millepora]XP_029198159.1 uncharacterized protein LOC114963196 [Acropora millepora]XP_029198160.1 uncharacterized protein LOC114963196 [Acropora millepora]XP_029198161.1 uncharacterized protein LOC114963196 [Acropora millepora]
MEISRLLLMRLLCIMLIVLLLLEVVDTRSLKKARRKSLAKHCGTKDHLCEHGSRKLCCAPGYTCKVATNWTKLQIKMKRNIGTCQEVLPLKHSEKEIEEHHPTQSAVTINFTVTKVQFSQTTSGITRLRSLYSPSVGH